jgi:glycosyltransferase involved in cell wall biosynthesis
MRDPRVSVCIPTFNRSPLLRQSIRSVLEQSFQSFELIVSDNASTDDTEQIVKSFGDDRITFAGNTKNVGMLSNWNRCLQLARGEFIAILPDDDLMKPENLAEKVATLSHNGNLGLVHSKYDLIDGDGQVLRENTNWGHGPDRQSDAIDGPEITLIPMCNMVNTPTVVLRRACYDRLGGFSRGAGFAFDYEYWMRIGVYYKVAFLAKPLVKWRIHSGAATHVHLGKNDVHKLRQVICAKRLLLYKHSSAIPAGIKRRIREQLCSVSLTSVEQLLQSGDADSEVRSILKEMRGTGAEFLCGRAMFKAWLKSVLGIKNTNRLKHVFSLSRKLS